MKNVSSNEKYILKLKIYHQIKNISSNKKYIIKSMKNKDFRSGLVPLCKRLIANIMMIELKGK